jgi:hypothetical protein
MEIHLKRFFVPSRRDKKTAIKKLPSSVFLSRVSQGQKTAFKKAPAPLRGRAGVGVKMHAQKDTQEALLGGGLCRLGQDFNALLDLGQAEAAEGQADEVLAAAFGEEAAAVGQLEAGLAGLLHQPHD